MVLDAVRPAGARGYRLANALRRRLPALQQRWDAAAARVLPLNAAELREAVERPAAQAGLVFASNVVDALLQDILGEPAALPLLQFTLLKLWEGRERNRVSRRR